MKRSVAATMSALSLATVGLSLGASMQSPLSAAAAAPAGILVSSVGLRAATATASPSASPTPTTLSPATAASTAAKSSTATVTVTGTAITTRYGPVQVQITVTNGKITAARALTYPTSDQHSAQINADAIPQLNQEVLTAQSATIDTVSGATYTSGGYQQSLQSALDAAHLA